MEKHSAEKDYGVIISLPSLKKKYAIKNESFYF